MSYRPFYEQVAARSACGDLDAAPGKHRQHKCERCPALIPIRSKFCKPCGSDVFEEKHRQRSREQRLRAKA